jgi:F0F1-type ATP synthase beta subunit
VQRRKSSRRELPDKGRDVLLFIDNIYHFTLTGTDIQRPRVRGAQYY